MSIPKHCGGSAPEKDPDSHRSIIKSTSLLSVGTLSSRILGFLRDVILARLLGTGFRADAFFVALKLPNLFRRITAEGAFSIAFVPMYSQKLETETEEIVGIYPKDASTAHEACEKFRQLGAKNIIITMGKDGYYFCCEEKEDLKK